MQIALMLFTCEISAAKKETEFYFGTDSIFKKKKRKKKRNILKSQLELFPCPSNHVTQSQIDYQMLELHDSFFIFPFSSIGEFRGDLKI